MKKTILVNIDGMATKKLILSKIYDMDLAFVETDSLEDFIFKINLLKDNIGAYIHELNYSTYADDFNLIKKASQKSINSMILLDAYSSSVIDDALGAGVSDLMVIPIKKDVLDNKLKSLVNVEEKQAEHANEMEDDVYNGKGTKAIVDLEIARAKRGKYSLLVIIIQLCNGESEQVAGYIGELKNRLRNTDVILRYSKDKIIVACPFTDKASIVEVENKIRDLYRNQFENNNTHVVLNMYGAAYPMDGDDSEALLLKLRNGLHNSAIIKDMKGTLNDISRDQIEKYKQMFRLN